MKRSEAHLSASGHARVRRAFFGHAVVFAAVMVLLIAINLVTQPGNLWFIWPLLGWGLAVALHGARVFLLSGDPHTADASVERASHGAGISRSGPPR